MYIDQARDMQTAHDRHGDAVRIGRPPDGPGQSSGRQASESGNEEAATLFNWLGRTFFGAGKTPIYYAGKPNAKNKHRLRNKKSKGPDKCRAAYRQRKAAQMAAQMAAMGSGIRFGGATNYDKQS